MMVGHSSGAATAPVLNAPAIAFAASAILHVLILLAPLHLWSEAAPGQGPAAIQAILAPAKGANRTTAGKAKLKADATRANPSLAAIRTSTAAGADLLLAAASRRSAATPSATATVGLRPTKAPSPELDLNTRRSNPPESNAIKALPGEISEPRSTPVLRSQQQQPARPPPRRETVLAATVLRPASPRPELAPAAMAELTAALSRPKKPAKVAVPASNTRTQAPPATGRGKSVPAPLSGQTTATRAATAAPTGANTAGNSFQAARFDSPAFRNNQPRYPESARVRGIQGRVFLEVRVSRFGKARGVRVKSSSGHKMLDKAALKAVRRWRFQPARRNGAPVGDMVVVPVSFKLTG